MSDQDEIQINLDTENQSLDLLCASLLDLEDLYSELPETHNHAIRLYSAIETIRNYTERQEHIINFGWRRALDFIFGFSGVKKQETHRIIFLEEGPKVIELPDDEH